MFRMRQYTTRASRHQHLFLGNRCPHCETGGREAGRIYTDATWLSDKLRLEMSTQYIFGKWDPKGLLPNYDKQLRQGRAFAKQLLEGCWRAFEGQYFNNWEPNRPGKPMVIARQLIQDDWWWTFLGWCERSCSSPLLVSWRL